jgi:hypothetical protein
VRHENWSAYFVWKKSSYVFRSMKSLVAESLKIATLTEVAVPETKEVKENPLAALIAKNPLFAKLNEIVPGLSEKLNTKLDEDSLKKLKTKYPLLPTAYTELFDYFDGEECEFFGLIFGTNIFSAKTVLEEIESATCEFDSKSYSKIQSGDWIDGRVPFAGGNGNYFLIDLVPGESGVVEQIISYDNDSFGESYVVANSFEEFMQSLLLCINDGTVKFKKLTAMTMGLCGVKTIACSETSKSWLKRSTEVPAV